ncbi:MAG TPA: alpha-L-arabinofuranosidase C-terminal domain-containing protein [bacterium]|nr:alpha-L-arabinofuranosidase C-terminal domain-containing protein [bacterium]
MAQITINTRRRIGIVDRGIFGGFIEHLGRCIYGGIVEEGSPLSDRRGFRRDVLDVLRPLRMPVLRWPGGNFVSGYHWTDAIGPVDRRPRRIELAWHGEESNRFGTDEFIEYCRALGAEPFIVVNMGSGSMDEAQAWVEYCNGSGDTSWANLRRKHGHEEPYRVKFWGLGNEMYGHWQIGSLTAEDYVKKARQFAAMMKRTDPSIQLISCGQQGWNEWDRIVLEGLADLVDYHSIHIYTGSDHYYTNVFHPHQADRALRICEALIERVRYEKRIEHPVHVAYDEWNVWYRERSAEARRSGIEERYTLADALAVAAFLNVFIRHCRTVRMANVAQLVNVIALIMTSPHGLFLQPIFHPFRLYAEHTREIALDAQVECDTYALAPEEEDVSARPHRVADLGPFPLLDVTATCDAEGRDVTLAVVNRNQTRGISTTIQAVDAVIGPGIVAYEVNGQDPRSVNSFDHPHAVSVQERQVAGGGGSRLTYEFPAHSVTVMRMPIG